MARTKKTKMGSGILHVQLPRVAEGRRGDLALVRVRMQGEDEPIGLWSWLVRLDAFVFLFVLHIVVFCGQGSVVNVD